MTEITASSEQTTMVNSTRTMSPIGDLFSRAWELTKLAWKKLLILSLLMYGIFLVFGLVVGLGTVGLFVGAFAGGGITANAIATGLLVLLVAVIFAMLIGTVFGITLILAMAEAKENPSIGSLLKRSFQLFVPAFLTSLITLFFVLGGTLFFIIPGIIISILFGFSMYEVVLGKTRYLAAIQNSIKIVSQNFGELFVRMLLVMAISIGVVILESAIQSGLGKESAASGLFSLIFMVFQAMLSWFMIAYFVELYKEARSITDFSKSASMLWIWIVSILGFLMSFFIFQAVASIASKLDIPAMLQNEEQRMMKDYDYNSVLDDSSNPAQTVDQLLEQYGDDMSDEEKQLFKQMMEQTNQGTQDQTVTEPSDNQL